MRPIYKYINTLQYLIIIICLGGALTAMAGKHPYQPLGKEIGYTVIEILKKHGMPVYHDRENSWFYTSSGSDSWIGGNPSFGLHFYKGQEIPLEAQLEIIQYCMKLHESRGRKEIIRIEMRSQPFKPELFRPKPYFELTLNVVK